MLVIPVIDVRHGLAVQAHGGRRDRVSSASDAAGGRQRSRRGCSWVHVTLCVPNHLYRRSRRHRRAWVQLGAAGKACPALPGVELWIDDGATPREAAEQVGSVSPATPVLGTESLRTPEDLTVLRSWPHDRYVLSLDFKGEGFDGPADALVDASHWPDRIVVMTLARVGSAAGPDVRRVAEIVGRSAGRSVYAAGGVRDRADVEALRDAGAAGVLVASALHAE